MSTETGGKEKLVLVGRVKAPVSGYGGIMTFRAHHHGPRRHARLERDAESPRARRELHWAGVMDEDVELTLLADPERPDEPLVDEGGTVTVTGYHLMDQRSTAEKLEGRKDWEVLLPRLSGLVRTKVLSTHRREMSRVSLEFVEAHEVVLWEDGSVTTIEHSTDGITGAFREHRMLPPLGSMADMLEQDEQGPYGEPRERGRSGPSDVDGLIDYGALRHVLERIVMPPAGNAPPTPRAAARRALLDPAVEMATSAREELGRRMIGGEE